jgi:hypothetical protein
MSANSAQLIPDEGFDDLLVTPDDIYMNFPLCRTTERGALAYKLEPRPNSDKTNKIPFNVRNGSKANNPELGLMYQEIKPLLKGYSGLGWYVEHPYVVIDVDDCVMVAVSESGEQEYAIADWVRQIVDEINSYTEISISRTGIHIWVKGVKPGDKCRKGIELYGDSRFMTISGYHVPGTPTEILERDISGIYEKMIRGDFKDTSANAKTASEKTLAPATSVQVESSGTAITTKLQLLLTGKIVSRKPFTVADDFGNVAQYDSQSECDLALATLLAFECAGDAGQIEERFRNSPLFRDKFNRDDYRSHTIGLAIKAYQKDLAEKTKTVAEVPAAVDDDDDEEFGSYVEERLPPFPQFTGVLNDLCEALSPDIPTVFKMSAALTNFGLARSGLDTLATEPHLQPRLFTVLVAEPGRGKTAAINEVGKVMKELGRGIYKSFSSIDSGPALCDAFDAINREQMMRGLATPEESPTIRPARIMLSPDEAKDVFEKGKSGANMRNSFLGELLKLFEQNETGNHARGSKTKLQIENAHLALIGGATLSGYRTMWYCTQGASEGLQSRIIPVGYDAAAMPGRQRPADAHKLNIAVQKLTEIIKGPAQQFQVSDSAWAIFDDWWGRKDQKKPSVTRLDGIAKRVAIILAATNERGVVDDSLMSQAILFADYILEGRERYNPKDATTLTQAMENAIIDCYSKHGDMSPNKCRKILHPYRLPGGAGVYKQAYQNLLAVGYLREIAKTHKTKIYRVNI